MPTKFDKLLPTLQENAWTGMVSHLADQLGVSSESLYKLGVGYLPAVQFKRGLNTQGWWVFPERDHDANVVGLSLRSWDGFKVMYPGSKHGMFYHVNPTHRKGEESYDAGAKNWVRTMDAGVDCPVCQKPDGCLLSADDPDDPQAVICIRQQSKRPQEMGWLHIRKDSGNLRPSSRAIALSDDPVVVVEGASDAAAALDLGFVAVGRPSNLAGLSELSRLVRGRDLIVLGENDRKWNPDLERWDTPGLDGLIAAFDYLRPHCRKVVRLMPPEEIKDLRQWVREGLTREDFLAAVENQGETRAELTHLDSSDPLYVAEKWLGREHSIGGKPVLRKYKGRWFKYEEGHYTEVDEDAVVRGGLYDFLEDKTYTSINLNGDETVMSYSPNRKKVNDVIDALNRDCPVSGTPPCWLNGVDGPDPTWLVPYPNGLLDVVSYLDYGNDALLDSTPDLFTLSTLPYAFDPTAECPAWLEFLESTFDDPAKIDLLQEWFGYLMIPDNSQEKMMLFRGPSRAGKGVTLAMLEALVGRDQTASMTFDELASPNGLAQCLGKLSAIMPDAVLSNRVDKPKALGTLLSVVGNDPVTVKKLYQDVFTSTIYSRFTIAVNELPTLPDHAGALENRLLVIEFTRSFKGKEDRTLKSRLPYEAPGVANWALEGLRRLRDRGQFTLPKSSQLVLDEFRKVSSPIAEFMEECCDFDHEQKGEVERHKLFEAWAAWGKERNINPGMPARFANRFLSKAPDVGKDTYQRHGKKRSVYTGVRLQPWAESRLLGKPT
jgi:putative DNA primase/helicase